MNGTLDDLYFQYLYDHVELPKRGRNRTYWKLLRQMYAKEFFCVVPQDHSRAEDGKEFRWEFVRAAGLPKVDAAWMYTPCSLLEMVIAVARRLSVLTDGELRPWFVQLLYNTGLDSYTDSNFDGYIQHVDERLDTLIRRTYSSNGEGGLFPLHRPARDQRDLEIWYQMNAWLIERERREG